jgi:hypothetical protein
MTTENNLGQTLEVVTSLTIKLDRLIVLSKSSLLGWFLHVSLIVIIKGRSPMEVSLIVIINPVMPHGTTARAVNPPHNRTCGHVR